MADRRYFLLTYIPKWNLAQRRRDAEERKLRKKGRHILRVIGDLPPTLFGLAVGFLGLYRIGPYVVPSGYDHHIAEGEICDFCNFEKPLLII